MTEDSKRIWKVDARVLELLVCPDCHGDLRVEADRLMCAACERVYPVVDGIPVLIPQS